jgi:hypothetical protein
LVVDKIVLWIPGFGQRGHFHSEGVIMYLLNYLSIFKSLFSKIVFQSKINTVAKINFVWLISF